jgi:uncharacterized protein
VLRQLDFATLRAGILLPPDIASRWLATRAILVYQKLISPYKGYRCAHRALYGRDSCSEYTKKSIAYHGLMKGVPIAQRRFKECGEAYKIIKFNEMNSALYPMQAGSCLADDKHDDAQCCPCVKVDTNPTNGCS